MSSKKNKRSSSVRSKVAWISQGNNGDYLPSWKATDSSEKETGYIKGGCLYARINKTFKVALDGESIPTRSDTIYLHPDTMTLCGLSIATPTLITNNSSNEISIIGKAWPSQGIELDAVGCSGAVLCSLANEGCDLVCIRSLPVEASSVPMATSVTLKHSGSGSIVSDKLFQSYLLIKNDGMFILEGSVLSVCYHGKQYYFTVDSFSTNNTANSSFDVTSSSFVTCNGSLSENFQHLDISDTPSQDTPIKDSMYHSTPNRPKSNPSVSNGDISTAATSVTLFIGKISGSTKLTFIDTANPLPRATLPCLSDIGGLKEQLQLMQDLILTPLCKPDVITTSCVQFPHGVILYGPSGTGKSLLASAIAGQAASHCVIDVFDAYELLDEHCKALDTLLELVQFSDGNQSRVIIINDIHYLVNESAQLRTLVKLLDFVNSGTCSCHVVVIATTNQIEAISGVLRQQGRLDLEIEVSAPSSVDRREIMTVLLRDIPHKLTEAEITMMSSSAHGYTGRDLKAVCREAQYTAFRRLYGNRSPDYGSHDFQETEEGRCSLPVGNPPDQRVFVEMVDLQKGQAVVKPSAIREITVEVPKVYWTDIGGEEGVKTKLKESVEWPLKYPEAFSRLGVEPPGGVLLYGPPGCSKTMIARALATESGLNFLSVKGPELFSKWVGDSERAVRQVFSRARAVAPSIIFFDEIDALATQRQGEGSKVGDRVLAQLLTEMDGLVSLKNVLIIAATNRPDILDKALLRPGRIDRLIYVSLPSPDTRREILKIRFAQSPVADDVNIDELTQHTERFSGAEICALVQEAALNAMHEDINSQRIHRRHFMAALEVVTPRTDTKMVEFYEQYNSIK